jgi:transposase-like protein
MADEIKAIDDLRRRFPNERACRRFLERSIWKGGRFCHHCGSLTTWPIRGPSARDGLYECADCHQQFSVTTRTPMHATKLPLWKWLLACYFLFQSSKGVSSVFLALWVGVSQKTAWKMGHAIREMMRTPDNAPLLAGVVEMDEKFIGGKPRFQKHVINKRGKGTKKAGVFIAVERQGQVRTAPIPNDGYDALSPLADAFVRKDAHLMTDGNPTYRRIGQDYHRHESVDHTSKEFVRGRVHNNTAESFGALLERMKFGTYHQISRQHLPRYLEEAAFRWNQRRRVPVPGPRKKVRYRMEPVPVLDMLGAALRNAVRRELRRTKAGGIAPPTRSAAAMRAGTLLPSE